MTATLNITINYNKISFDKIQLDLFIIPPHIKFGNIYISELSSEGSSSDTLVKFVTNNTHFVFSKIIFDILLQDDNILLHFYNWLEKNNILNIWSNNKSWNITFDIDQITFRSTDEYIRNQNRTLNYFINK